MIAFFSLRGIFAAERMRLAASLLLALIAIAAGVGLLGVSGWFLTAASIAGAGSAFNLFAPSSLVRGLSLLRIGTRYGERIVGHDATLRVLSHTRAWLLGILFPKLPLARRSLRHGDMVSRLTTDVDALANAFLTVISPLMSALLVGAALTATLAWLLPSAALPFGLLFAIATLAIPAMLVSTTRSLGRTIARQSADLRMAVLDGVDGVADLQAFGATAAAQVHFSEATADLASTRGRLAARNALAASALVMVGGLAMLGVVLPGVEALDQGSISAPLLIGLILAVLGSFEAPAAVLRSLAKFTVAAASAERLHDLSQSAPRIREPANPVASSARSDLTFEAVTFAYDDRPVLDGFTLAIAQGDRVALKGESGSGKSTVLQLAARLLDPQSGTVRIGGGDVRTFAPSAHHAKIAYLEQSAPVFGTTIRANLLIGNASADDAALWDALALVKLDDFVRTIPHGLDAILGEAGRTLSAGQARRLCLARCILSKAPILLLDEPTSGLDRSTELAFWRDLPAATHGRTVLLATHSDLPAGTVHRSITMQLPGTRP